MQEYPHDTVILTTPRGHEVVGEFDYATFALLGAKAIHHFTGVMTPVSAAIANDLARALQAKQIYEQAVESCAAIEQGVQGLGLVASALGNNHPALKPYTEELEKHRAIAADMRERAGHFYTKAAEAIDRQLEG